MSAEITPAAAKYRVWQPGSGDEMLVCEGDLIGEMRERLRSLHPRRNRDWLQF